MLFNSGEFLIFLPIVVLLYFVLPKKVKNLWLLIASYYFYMCWNAKFLLLILFSTVVTFACGLFIEYVKHEDKWNDEKKTGIKKIGVAVCFILNLGVLIYFKYTNFLVHLLVGAASLIHIDLQIPYFDIMLPVGISFYTFQALGYTIDVYRDEIYAEKNFIEYALFVSFFPQLVAGPIERSKNLLKQLAVPKKFDFENFKEGLLLMLWGFFLKIVFADRVSTFVDTVYAPNSGFDGWYIFIATSLFGFQIYCDFYGYSIIAKGTAKIMGIDLMENFETPYLCRTISEFWRNWHISLTSWFKDYLYFPLGGSRCSKAKKYRNVLIVFVTSGLWHGADLHFVLWGLLNGLYQVIGEILMPIRNFLVDKLHLHRESLAHRAAQAVSCFLLMDVAWVLFRSRSVTDAIRLFKATFAENNIWILFDGGLFACGLNEKNFLLVMFCLLVLSFADVMKKKKIYISKIILAQDAWFQVLTIVFGVCFILVFGVWGPQYIPANFIYFQF